MVKSAIAAALFVAAIYAQSPEQRAVDYLSREVPRWFRENQCWSCHNNGDGARALYAAARRGYRVPPGALAATTAWLSRPGEWDRNRGNPAFSDKVLARIQFAAALAAQGARAPLVEAARSLIPSQHGDGSWQVDSASAAGSPVTYGPALATWLVRETLERAGVRRWRETIVKANAYLRAIRPTNNLDSAVQLLAFPNDSEFRKVRGDALIRAQTADGGWGPFPLSPSEVFDTSVVLLALRESGGSATAIARGREFLIRQQMENGGWTETTRPSGGHSYAQHISTTGWATLALLATDAKRQ